MFHIPRRKLSTIASALALSAALALPSLADAKTITAVMHADLRTPGMMTTAYIVRDFGYMIFDTLLAEDASFKIEPQMADWKVSGDKLTYTFTLRDGLKWHDGAPVTAEDCAASLKRWGKADSMGQKLMDFTASIEATDARTITLKLKEPYGLVLESIGKPSSLVPFMMPKRMAESPADKPLPIFSDIPPVGPLTVTLRTGHKPSRVTWEPEGVALPFEYNKGEVKLVVARLGIHGVLLVH